MWAVVLQKGTLVRNLTWHGRHVCATMHQCINTQPRSPFGVVWRPRPGMLDFVGLYDVEPTKNCVTEDFASPTKPVTLTLILVPDAARSTVARLHGHAVQMRNALQHGLRRYTTHNTT